MTGLEKTNTKPAIKLDAQRKELLNSFAENDSENYILNNAALLDDYFCEMFEKSDIGPKMMVNKTPFTIVAQGGYGRREQCAYSDVDILFLFSKTVPPEAESLIREFIYPLWDIGLEVGHATRTIKDCITLAGEDIEIFTAILDARFICGMSPIFSQLTDQLRSKLIVPQSRKLTRWIVEKSEDRHQQFGDSTSLLEPHLKEGLGGLRDYHSMMWLAKIKSDVKDPRDLEYSGLLSHEEFNSLIQALKYIWDIRNRLHLLSGRKNDQLHFEYQVELAERLGYTEKSGQKPVEHFLGELHMQMEFIKQHHLMIISDLGRTRKVSIKKSLFKRSKVEGLDIKMGMIGFTSSEEVLHSPELLIKIFEESARLKLPINSEAKRIISAFGYLADDFGSQRSTVKSFERTLTSLTPTFNVMGEMLNTGFLVHFIPEFETIVNRIQYNQYHIYPVDRHSIKVVQTLKQFSSNGKNVDPLCHNLYRELSDRKVIMWAALLHDIGKGEETDDHAVTGAHIAKDILKRAGSKPKHIDTIYFLIENHLLLPIVATRRDINDEETALYCAGIIKTPDRLKMLYLLTVSDSISTGPKAWSDWKASLLRDLFLKVLNVIQRGELGTEEAEKEISEKKFHVLNFPDIEMHKEELERHIEGLKPRYLLSTTANEIIEHIKLHCKLGDNEFAWNISRDETANTRSVAICAKDKPGLFSRIAGVFTINNLDILTARINDWHRKVALDVFELKPPVDKLNEESRWKKVEDDLSEAFSGGLDLAALVAEKISEYEFPEYGYTDKASKVEIDNEGSSFFTIIEVYTYNFPGLLFTITNELYNLGLNIEYAKIATHVEQVIDIFYVRDLYGEKLNAPDQLLNIQNRIESVLASIRGGRAA